MKLQLKKIGYFRHEKYKDVYLKGKKPLLCGKFNSHGLTTEIKRHLLIKLPSSVKELSHFNFLSAKCLQFFNFEIKIGGKNGGTT